MVIKNLRLKHGWSQEQLANITGLSTRTIQRIEKDDEASLESLKALAHAFEMDIQTLHETLTHKGKEMQDVQNVPLKGSIVVFICVNVILFAINMLTNPHHIWFIYPLLGWGLVLLIKHYKRKNALDSNAS